MAGSSASTVRMASVLALAVLALGCSEHHIVGGDGGAADLGHDGSVDLGLDGRLPDFGIRDAGTYDGPEDCSDVAGYRRCDERCLRPCTSPARCLAEIGLCVVRPPTGYEGCTFSAVGVFPRTGGYCPWSGGPCLVYEGDGAAERWHGFCLGADVCVAAEGRGLPFTCRYGDGSSVVSGPPGGVCPSPVVGAPWCGGSCGGLVDGCPNTDGPFGTNITPSCIGLSDTRAFGVCVYDEFDCEDTWRRFGPDQYALMADACGANYGAPCACMQVAGGPGGALSYFVKADACVGYRRAFPGSVECLDGTHTPLP